jgi:HK97 family phage portal protein
MAWWSRKKRTATEQKAVSPVSVARSGWYSIMEPFSGAWQRNVTVNRDTVLSFHAVFACQSLIASDISKLPLMLMQRDSDGVWTEVNNPAYSPVLRRPNGYQTTKQFIESWVISKLQSGNTYVLKERDQRRVVTKLHVLDPRLVTPLVSDDGSVFYELSNDKLAGLNGGNVIVPASEIIHDRFNTIWHPLVGVSPIFAAGLAATQGLSIQEDNTLFFQNGARPGGVLIAPGAIADTTATRLKEYWDENFSGSNAGKVAVLGDGLKYEAMKSKAIDSQVIDQLKWSAEVVCGVYHVPPFMIGVGAEPTYDNVQTVTLRYYSQCLQVLIVDIVTLLDDGLGMDGTTLGCEFDTDELLRMDALTQMDVLEKSKGKLTVNEQRKRLNRGPVTGGDTVYLQEQDHSLEWLAKRDAMPIEAPEPVTAPEPSNDNEIDAEAKTALITILKGLR